MERSEIVITGIGNRLDGLTWKSESVLHIGSQDNMDIVLKDASVSRKHASIIKSGNIWVIRDLANHPRQLTLLNGNRLGRGDFRLKPKDILQFGNLSLQVSSVEVLPGEGESPKATALPPILPGQRLKNSGSFVRVQATANNSWDQALLRVSHDLAQKPERGQAMLTLLRTGQHLCHIASLDELLQSILSDVISALGAQRGSIVLANPYNHQLELRATQGNASEKCYSRTLAARVFSQGESLLCRDVQADEALQTARSVRAGTMASIICVLLRSPRQRLGVLQLDRGPFQDPFEENDLFLADAIAATVAVGIESAQLVEQQRDQFVQTVTSLARAVEVRDQYTGQHTHRVTDYAMLLADELKLSALEKYQIQIGTPLHDIGKIGIDDAILRKPGRLTSSEFDMMKTHTVKGAEILGSISNLHPMIPIVRHHHERWDGSGYPDRLTQNEIAQTARIVAVADAFDAMTSDRAYRPALPTEQAFLELQRNSGTHFDPQCILAFLRLRPQIEARLRTG